MTLQGRFGIVALLAASLALAGSEAKADITLNLSNVSLSSTDLQESRFTSSPA